MRKILCIISVALLALTACTSNDDNPATSDLGVKEKIMGKWMKSEQNGQPLPTDGKMVYTFVSPTKAYMSASIDASSRNTSWTATSSTPAGRMPAGRKAANGGRSIA